MIDRALRFLDDPPRGLWPAVLVLLAATSVTAAWLLQPGPDELCSLFGRPFGGECAFTTATGHPCPQCGMTRAFAWGARGHLVRAFWYNPAGLTLFLWIQAGGVVGLARLLTGRDDALRPPTWWIVGWALTWLIALYALGWVLRLLGVNPLP